MATLLKFNHGLGDAVQLAAALDAVRRRSDEEFDVFCLRGKHSALKGHCRRAYHEQEPRPDEREYDRVLDLAWPECGKVYPGLPSTKTVRCLDEVFGITELEEPEDLWYAIEIGQEVLDRTADYLRKVCNWSAETDVERGRFPVLLLHYQGNTSADRKNLSVRAAQRVCAWAMAAGLVPVILDWDRRSPLPDGKRIHCPGVGAGDLWRGFGSGDAEVLAALIEQSAVFVGVDSGPLHVAGATSTPTLGVWVGHHPLRYFDLAANVVHLVPDNWQSLPPCGERVAQRTFEEIYAYTTYPVGKLPETIPAALKRLTGIDADPLTGGGKLVRHGELVISAQHPAEDLVIVRDILDRDAYRLAKLETAGGPEVVVDIGAHIGTFAMAWHRRNPQAQIACVEVCPENLAALMVNVGHFAEVYQAACTYEAGELALLNAAGEQCVSTGGSIVVRRDELPERHDPQYYQDLRPLETITLEEICRRMGVLTIDVLKLDCEGSEFSILENTTMLSSIGMIVGEFHGYARWQKLIKDRFAGWRYVETSRNQQDDNGTFRLVNPGYEVYAAKRSKRLERPDPVKFAIPVSAEMTEQLESIPGVKMQGSGEGGETWTPATGNAEDAETQRAAEAGLRIWTPDDRPTPTPVVPIILPVKDPAEAPIIVTGTGRSGTTWMQFALSQHLRCHVHGQEPIRTDFLWHLLEQFTLAGRSAGRKNAQVGYDVAHYAGSDERRTAQLVRDFYAAWIGGYGRPTERWGAKFLGMASDPAEIERWERLWPDTRYVVCLRDVWHVIESQKNTFEPTRKPAEIVEAWLRCAEFADRSPRAVLWRIDQVEQLDRIGRRRAMDRVLEICGLVPSAEVDAFVDRWPCVHKVKPDVARTFTLSAEQRADLLQRYPRLRDFGAAG